MTLAKTKQNNGGRLRNSAVRSGLVAVSTAVCGLVSSMTARADITNGFASFGAVNVTQASGSTTTSTLSTPSLGSIGVSADKGTFTATDGRGYLASSIFDPTAQNITSFEAVFDYQATAGADGGAFVLESPSGSTTALGGDGGSGGYDSSTTPAVAGIANSAAFQMEIYNGNQVFYDTGGTKGSSTAFSGTQNPTLGSGDKIQVTLEYFNNTLTANLVDLTNGKAFAKIYGGANIATAVGGSTALVGFTGGTGGSTTTQNFSNFTFVSNPTFAPVAVTGFNQKGIISIAQGPTAVTATMDGGTARNGDTWYEQGYNTYNSSTALTGLPTSGALFTSQADTSHTFQMQNYSSDDVVLLTSAAATNSGTMTLTTPGAYSALSFLTASGNGPSSFKVTINYADGAVSTTNLSVISPDWFNGTPSSWLSNGRATVNQSSGTIPDNINQTPENPNLYEEDLLLPDSTDPISSVNMSWAQGGNIMVFALSGVAASNSPVLTYTGAAIAGKFDDSTQNFSQTINGSTGAATFSNGDIVIFDDTAVDTAHNIVVSTVSGGLQIGGLVFNNTTATNAYMLTGAGLGGPGGISVNGGGTVILDNPNTFSGGATVNLGTLIVGPGGKLASNFLSVSPGAALEVSGGSLTGTAINLTDSGTVSDDAISLSLAGLNGSGALNFTNSSNTALTITGGGSYSGTISQSGTLNLTVNSTNASTGAVILSGTNSYTGTTTLVAGALEVGQGSLSPGNINLAGGSLGAFAPQVNLSNTITGGALIIPSGTNALELSGSANTFAGPVVIQSPATLQLDSAGSIGGINGANSSSGFIIVASGATLIVNDNSGTLGLTGGVVGGAPITATLSGAGAGNNGALRGPDNQYVTWAGNVNVSGPAQISPGFSGQLTVSGGITGNGPVTFAPNSNSNSSLSTLVLSPPTATSNNYTGETEVVGANNSLVGFTVQLGNDNGFSPVSGLNFNGGTGPVTVDLNGNNQSVTYLTGGAVNGSAIINSQSNVVTLTVTSGLKGGTASNFGTPLQGPINFVMNDPTGAGNQIISGANSYSGGTTITKGTLSVMSSGALGSGTVFLNGGTLAFPGSNLNSFSGFTTQAKGATGAADPPSSSGGTLTLTTAGAQGIAASAFTPQQVALNLTTGFNVSYVVNLNANNTGYVADGIAFVLQNDPAGAAAIGNSGGGIGYTGLQNSFAAGFETYGYDFGGGGENDVEFGTGGTLTQITTSGMALTSEPALVTLTYNGSQFSETLTGQGTEGGTYTTTFPVDLASVLGSSMAYVGFTAGTGDGTATQTVSNFSISNVSVGANSIPNPIVANPNTTSNIQVSATGTGTTEPFSSLTLSAGSVVNLQRTNGSAASLVVQTPSLSMATNEAGAYTAQLNIGTASLDLPNASLGTINSMVAQGYASGTWTGQGIVSSAAATDSTHLTAVGVIANDNGSGTPLYSTFEGATVADGDILVKLTYYGDTNLDGTVDGSDYSRIDNGALNGLTGWFNGDFNYDGVIDGSDYTLIDNAYNTQGVQISSQVAATTAQVASGAVPEPTSLALVGLGAAGLLSRRRRRI